MSRHPPAYPAYPILDSWPAHDDWPEGRPRAGAAPSPGQAPRAVDWAALEARFAAEGAEFRRREALDALAVKARAAARRTARRAAVDSPRAVAPYRPPHLRNYRGEPDTRDHTGFGDYASHGDYAGRDYAEHGDSAGHGGYAGRDHYAGRDYAGRDHAGHDYAAHDRDHAGNCAPCYPPTRRRRVVVWPSESDSDGAECGDAPDLAGFYGA